MRRAGLAATGGLLALGACGAAWCEPGNPPSPDTQSFSLIERGHYLTLVGDCAACHTAPGGKPFAGGLKVETPFGNVVSPNITPDRETGIGGWTDQQFVKVLQQGESPGGVHLYPAMPYPYMSRASTADDLAIRAYLSTLPAVKNKVVSDQLPFPFDIRASMLAWNALYFSPGRFKDDPQKSATWNRGAYLVNGLAHCAACHTPKTILGGDQSSAFLKGAKLQGWFAPDITNDMRTGLGRWSVADIVAYLQTGHNRFAAAAGPMSQEVEMSSAHMRADDLQAIADYLKSLGGTAQSVAAQNGQDKVMLAGAAIYRDECSACHAPRGQGVADLFPALDAAPSVQARSPASLIRVVLQGAQSAATDRAPTGPAMPAFGWMMDDAQVAAVVTYVRNSWGNAASVVTASDVAADRKSLARRTD